METEDFAKIACECRLTYGRVTNNSFSQLNVYFSKTLNFVNESGNREVVGEIPTDEDARQLALALKHVQQNNIEEDQKAKVTSIIIAMLMGVGIPANLFLLVVTAMSKRRKNNLQRSSSILFSLLAVVDILLFLISIIKLKRDRSDNFDFVDSNFMKQLLCKSYSGIKVVCMLFSVMMLCATALFRFFHIAYPAHAKRDFGWKIAILVLVLAILATIPIFKYQQISLIGVDEIPHCRWEWRAPERELCKEAELRIPEFKYDNCSRPAALCHSLPNYRSETVYWIVIVIVFILTPIGASFMAYCGLINRLHSSQKATGKKGKEYDVLIRNIQLFSSSLGLAWAPVVFWRVIRLIPSLGENGQFSEKFCESMSKTAGLTPLISGVLNPFLYSFFGNVFLQDLTKAKANLFRKVPSLELLFKRLTRDYGATRNSTEEIEPETVHTTCMSSREILIAEESKHITPELKRP